MESFLEGKTQLQEGKNIRELQLDNQQVQALGVQGPARVTNGDTLEAGHVDEATTPTGTIKGANNVKISERKIEAQSADNIQHQTDEGTTTASNVQGAVINEDGSYHYDNVGLLIHGNSRFVNAQNINYKDGIFTADHALSVFLGDTLGTDVFNLEGQKGTFKFNKAKSVSVANNYIFKEIKNSTFVVDGRKLLRADVQSQVTNNVYELENTIKQSGDTFYVTNQDDDKFHIDYIEEGDASHSIIISADDVRYSNIIHVCDITSQVMMIDCNSTRTLIDGNKFAEGAQTGLAFIDVNGGGANACDGVQIVGNEFYAPTAANYNAAIELGEVADGVVIDSNVVWGDFDDACIHNPTGKVFTNLTISNNTLTNLLSSFHAIELVSACTGVAAGNFMYTDTYATTFDPGALACFENYSVSSVDKNARLNPVVET